MAQPTTVNDTVLYTPRYFHADQNIQLNLLDGSQLDIWGPVFVNGDPLGLIGSIPIATQAEAEAGTNNTKVMTPLRTSQHLTANWSAQFTNNSATNAKLADVATNTIKGRRTAATGDPEDLTPALARAVIASDSGSATVFLNGAGNFTTPVAVLADGDKGDITVGGTGTTLTIDAGVVTNAKLTTVPTNTFKGRLTAGTGVPEELTAANARTVLASDAGASPSTKFLCGDATWAVPPTGGGGALTDGDKGDIVVSASGATWMFDSSVVTATAKTLLDDSSTAAMLSTLGAQPLDSDLTTIAGLTATTDNVIQSVGSAWASRTPAQLKTSLALTKTDVGLGNVDNTSDAAAPVSTAQQTALDLKQPKAQTINTQTGTTYTLALTDAGSIVATTNAAAVAITIPTNASVAIPVGSSTDIVQDGTGQITIGGAGITFKKAMATAKTRVQNSVITAIKLATDTWLLTGDAAIS